MDLGEIRYFACKSLGAPPPSSYTLMLKTVKQKSGRVASIHLSGKVAEYCFTAEHAEGAEKRYGAHGRARRTLGDLGALCGE